MRSATVRSKNPAALGLIIPVVILLTLCSCAKTPWTSLVEGESRNVVLNSYMNFLASQDGCQSSWDAEVDIRWTSSVRNFSFSGYGQVMEPAYLKFIVPNPLGQPIRIIVTNGVIYRDIDTVKKTIVSGEIRSWALRHELPLSLVNATWLDWIGGRSSAPVEQIAEIRLDSENRGTWLSISSTDPEAAKEHILLNWEHGTIIERILLDDSDRKYASLTYSEWQELDQCLYPVVLSIEGLPLGGKVDLRFTEIRQTEFKPADFNVDIPGGFQKTWLH